MRVGDTIHVCGTVAPGETTAEQTLGCYKIIGDAIVDAGGNGLSDVVGSIMIAADVRKDVHDIAAAHKEAFQEVFDQTGMWPNNTLYGGTLWREGLLIEIEATAIVTGEKANIS